ncbi:MAG: porin [Piscinibacter sp.]|uniref:porin n=1 Tax=Piscinibacter sp. TaxID=1903157 RepID=UPI002584D86C|nr:porin [Piscinibacter sp.]MCW5667105.1 porin [Piscinibacter sp.]
MKKSLLALAVLGAFAGAASAQSSVTIYGVVDLAIQKSNGGNTYSPGVCEVPSATGTCGPLGTKAWKLQQSTASRLGFRGNEDLGGGLSAQFQIEHRFTPDDGAFSGAFWGGRSYVQLTSASAGSVYLGREYAPFFWLAAKSDPFGLNGVGQFTGLLYLLSGTHETAMGADGIPTANPAGRQTNSVGYKTPNLGGLTANVAVGLGEGTLAGGRDTGFNVEYAAGPIYAGVGYGKKTGGNANNDGNTLFNMALHYDFGVAKLIGYYGRSKTGVNSDGTNKFFLLGATAPLGPGLLKAGFGQLTVSDDGSSEDFKDKKFSIGYDYNLSKRTNLYVDFSTARDNDDSPGSKNSTAYAFGLRHTF